MPHGLLRAAALLCAAVAGTAQAAPPPAPSSLPAIEAPRFDARSALEVSQAAMGRKLPADLAFTDHHGERRTLGEFRGRPLVISPVYTSCYMVCPTTTANLRQVAGIATSVLGAEAFTVLTIGFDTANDTPERMRDYAAQRGIDSPQWVFAAADPESTRSLLQQLGFTYVPTPRGFDHMIQATVVDRDGRIYRQVYGQQFDAPLLVDPLKRLALGQQAGEDTLAAVVEGVRLLCTVFDPKSGRYRFDYSLVLSFVVGVMCLGGIAAFILHAWRTQR
jgi:protein SCO1/2